MCGLCGVFGATDHWTGGLEAGFAPAAERQARARIANEVLALYGLRLNDWAGRFTLTSRTGKMAVVEHFGAIWPEAERLAGRSCDPLDPAVLDELEAAAR